MPELQAVPRDLVLGQVRAALRPSNVDPVEVREVLLTALSLGYDPSDLYLQAVRERPKQYEPAPPLSKVLPSEVLKRSASLGDPDLEPEDPALP